MQGSPPGDGCGAVDGDGHSDGRRKQPLWLSQAGCAGQRKAGADRVARAFSEAHAPQPRVVVLGAQADLLGDLVLSGEWSIVVNKGWASGVGSSVRTGLASVPDAEQVVETLGDLAWLQAEAIERVVGHA